jgi:nicotinamide mononucleotide transporter
LNLKYFEQISRKITIIEIQTTKLSAQRPYTMPSFFSINNVFFDFLGYKMSHLEWWATLTGGVAVWLSTKENVWSWVLGLVNVTLAFVLFYQIQLYPDMLLQVFFFVTNVIGWWQWKFPKTNEANLKNELKISRLDTKQVVVMVAIGLLGTAVLGTFASHLHAWLPSVFSLPTAFPYMDSFTTVMSIVATFMLIRKKIEAWFTWLLVDVISTYIYYLKDVKLYALLYLIFCFIAIYGAYNWSKTYKKKTNV